MVISGLIVFSLAQRRFIALGIAALLLLLPLSVKQLQWYTPINEKTREIVLIQGNIPQSLKWDPEFLDKTKQIYIQLSALYR